MKGDVLQNRIRLLLNCSYFVFFSLQELDYYCAVWNLTCFQKNLNCVQE